MSSIRSAVPPDRGARTPDQVAENHGMPTVRAIGKAVHIAAATDRRRGKAGQVRTPPDLGSPPSGRLDRGARTLNQVAWQTSDTPRRNIGNDA